MTIIPYCDIILIEILYRGDIIMLMKDKKTLLQIDKYSNCADQEFLSALYDAGFLKGIRITKEEYDSIQDRDDLVKRYNAETKSSFYAQITDDTQLRLLFKIYKVLNLIKNIFLFNLGAGILGAVILIFMMYD